MSGTTAANVANAVSHSVGNATVTATTSRGSPIRGSIRAATTMSTTPTMKRAKYEKELAKLQVRLCHLQRWVKEQGLRVVIVFEGRDGAGKGGTIRAITERLSPRVFRVVALPAPSDREKSQMYLQRYLPHFPAAGEGVIFERSRSNRAGGGGV